MCTNVRTQTEMNRLTHHFVRYTALACKRIKKQVTMTTDKITYMTLPTRNGAGYNDYSHV